MNKIYIIRKFCLLMGFILAASAVFSQLPGLSFTEKKRFTDHGSTVVVNPQPKDFIASAEYQIEVNGHPVFMYAQPGFANGTVNFASFDFSGPVTVKVISTWTVYSAEVHPLSAKIPCKVEGKTITFTLDKPLNIYLKMNGTFELPVYIFANPISDYKIDRTAKNVKYFGPGIHEVGDIELKSGETLFLDAGAVVYGAVYADNAHDVKIIGRGIICGSHYPFQYSSAKIQRFINFRNCQNVEVEGVIILDSFSWTLVFQNCDNVKVERTRILSERLWSTDGLNPCSSRNVTIDNCFIRSKDDCISVKGMAWEPGSKWYPINNIHVKNCVFWSENNNALVVGCESRAERIENVVFENCDILKSTNTCGDISGTLSVICLDDTYMSDITFDNIRVEYNTTSPINIFYTNLMFGNIPGSRKPEGGILKNITFRNISFTGNFPRTSFVNGLDSKHQPENITFENLSIGGKKVLKAADGNFEINSFTKNIQFQ